MFQFFEGLCINQVQRGRGGGLYEVHIVDRHELLGSLKIPPRSCICTFDVSEVNWTKHADKSNGFYIKLQNNK